MLTLQVQMEWQENENAVQRRGKQHGAVKTQRDFPYLQTQ